MVKKHHVIKIAFNWFRYSMGLLVFFLKIIIFYMHWCFASVCVCTTCIPGACGGPKEDVASLGTGATNYCQLHMSGFWERNLGPLEEQPELSTNKHLSIPYDFLG